MALNWADECSGRAGQPPDPALWGVRETDEWQPAGELQTYIVDKSTAQYDGLGHLVITARRTADGGYTSARLSARHSSAGTLFRYGLFEARIRVPVGSGVWPAFWLLGEDDRYGWPDCGEIDIMEAPSSDSTRGQIHQGTHSPRAGETHSPHTSTGDAVGVGVTPSRGDWAGTFHTYAADWAPHRIDFYVDGRRTGSVTESDVRDHGGIWRFDERAQAPILNLAVGGWAGAPDGSWEEQSMLVDWVRVHDGLPGDERGHRGRG